MTVENQAPELPPASAPASATARFIRGFAIRLLYGSFAIPLLVIFRPQIFSDPMLPAQVFAVVAYLLVCIAGGAFDAANGITRTIGPLFQKPRTRDVLILAIILLSLWLGRVGGLGRTEPIGADPREETILPQD